MQVTIHKTISKIDLYVCTYNFKVDFLKKIRITNLCTYVHETNFKTDLPKINLRSTYIVLV
jgi:hypothetical protein